MRGPLIISSIFHVTVVLVAWLGLPDFFDRSLDLPPPPIEVEMITEGELAELTTAPEPPAPKKAPPPPPPPPPEPASEPEPEAEIIPEKVKEIEKPKVKPPEKKKQVVQMRPTAKPAEPKKKPEKKKEFKKDFTSVLKTVQKIKDAPKPQPEKKKEKKKEEPKKMALADILKKAQSTTQKQPRREITESSSLLSNSELDAVKQQIAGCWNIQPGAMDADNLIVRLRVQMNPDMSVRSVEIVDQGDSSNPFWAAAARSARAAVLKCSPLRVPPNKYDVWEVINFTFDPKQMFG